MLIVTDMEWVSGFDNGEQMLAALHPPYALVIWDIRNKTKLWKKTYTETLMSFSFDPFAPSKLACKFVCSNFLWIAVWYVRIFIHHDFVQKWRTYSEQPYTCTG
jgi:hypothetical protein